MGRGAGVRGAVALAAVVGLAAILAVGDSAAAGQPYERYVARSATAKPKRHKTAKKCKWVRSRETGSA